MKRETITLDARAQWRLYVLNHILAGEISAAEASTHLGLSIRSVRRLLARYRTSRPAEETFLIDTGRMPADGSLKRLGGGRWETRDGRFAIEPQSGTWVVVDNTQTDELGLPLVRGPFGSLTAVREAIEGVRTAGPPESPLADRLKQAKAAEANQPKRATPSAVRTAETAGRGVSGKPRHQRSSEAHRGPPEVPVEPKWLRDLDPADRRRARDLIERLGKLVIAEPEEIARSEIARNQPAVARVAIERAVRHAIASTRSPTAAARAAIDVILTGKDLETGARWRLVDDQGRRIDQLDISDPMIGRAEKADV